LLHFKLDDGTEHEFDPDVLALSESVAVYKNTNLGIYQFILGCQQFNPLALKAMVWLTRTRNGEKIKFDDIEFDVLKFSESLRSVGPDDDAEPEDEKADPTRQESTPTLDSESGMTPSSGEQTT
jgi:hypothetical protein